jgi:hypothetical protein
MWRLTEKIDETLVDIEAVETSIGTWTEVSRAI